MRDLLTDRLVAAGRYRIFHAGRECGEERWRILARFTVRVDDDGTPRARVEAVDAHPAGR